MSGSMRGIAGPALGVTALIAVIFAIDDGLWNRFRLFVGDIFMTSGQLDGLMMTFLVVGAALFLLMFRS